MKKRKKVAKINKKCGLGDLGAKKFMKSYIKDLITQVYKVSEDNIDLIIDFENIKSAQDKFDVIFYKYKKEFRFNALQKIIKKYVLNELKDFKGEKKYVITKEDIDEIYEKENIHLNFEDKLEILCQRIYQNSKGLGVIDEIRDQDIDGLSLGVNGIPEDFLGKLFEMKLKLNKDTLKEYPKSYDAIWLYFEGAEIHLSFLSFESFKELERVCKTTYKFNTPKHFSRSEGYIFNTMADLSRVVVFRPPFCETWVCFIRKEDKDLSIEDFISEEIENADIVKGLLTYSPKGKQRISIIGPQGSGKTALLKVLVEEVYPTITLRIWEDFFEAYLRFKYPYRDITTIKSTSNIDGGKGLDILRKSNGQMILISEAAEDIVISYIIKVCRISDESIIWCHHATSNDDLVGAMVTSCINTRSFTREDIAEREISKVLGINVKLGIDKNKSIYDGKKTRYPERISEFIPIKENDGSNFEYSAGDIENTNQGINKAFNIIAEYLQKKNSRKYKAVDIVEYDKESKKYIVKNNMSPERIEQIKNSLLPEDREGFLDLIRKIESRLEKKVVSN